MHIWNARRTLTAACAVPAITLGSLILAGTPAFAQTALVPSSGSGNSINTVAGNGQRGSSGDGTPAVNAELRDPGAVAENLTGDLYIADTGNNQIRKVVSPTTLNLDTISTVAGTGMAGFGGDHGAAVSAELRHPQGVAVDNAGDLFIADTGNNRVREVLPNGAITTFAGDGMCIEKYKYGPHHHGSSIGDGGPATDASLCDPTSVAVDSSGDVYIADAGHHLVRTVTPQGTISTFAGTGRVGRSGDGGPAANAELGYPVTVVVNSARDVFIADAFENDVREVNQAGIISTLIGSGPAGFWGDPGQRFWGDHGRYSTTDLFLPQGLGVDVLGDVFVGDTGHNRILEVNSQGAVSVYAGTGRRGFSGDGGPATQARLDHPQGSFAWDADALYFADTGNQRVRGVFSGPPPVLPEATTPALLVIGAAVIFAGGAALVTVRRRRAATR